MATQREPERSIKVCLCHAVLCSCWKEWRRSMPGQVAQSPRQTDTHTQTQCIRVSVLDQALTLPSCETSNTFFNAPPPRHPASPGHSVASGECQPVLPNWYPGVLATSAVGQRSLPPFPPASPLETRARLSPSRVQALP